MPTSALLIDLVTENTGVWVPCAQPSQYHSPTITPWRVNQQAAAARFFGQHRGVLQPGGIEAMHLGRLGDPSRARGR